MIEPGFTGVRLAAGMSRAQLDGGGYTHRERARARRWKIIRAMMILSAAYAIGVSSTWWYLAG